MSTQLKEPIKISFKLLQHLVQIVLLSHNLTGDLKQEY